MLYNDYGTQSGPDGIKGRDGAVRLDGEGRQEWQHDESARPQTSAAAHTAAPETPLAAALLSQLTCS